MDFHAPGRILDTQTFRAAGVFRILPTHTFRVAVTVAFYLHKLFGLPSPSQLHCSYTNFSDGRGFAFYLHTRVGTILTQTCDKSCQVCQIFRAARGLLSYAAKTYMHKWMHGEDLHDLKQFVRFLVVCHFFPER